jgi:hypothetical protein
MRRLRRLMVTLAVGLFLPVGAVLITAPSPNAYSSPTHPGHAGEPRDMCEPKSPAPVEPALTAEPQPATEEVTNEDTQVQ